MNNKCSQCGADVAPGLQYCPNCGAQQNSNQAYAQQQMAPQQPMAQQQNYQNNYGGGSIEKRGIALCIVLTLITCSIYSYFWVAKIQEDLNTLTGDHKTSGGMVVLLSIVTCGIYSFFWYYNSGKRLATACNTQDNSILYLILPFLGLGIVSMALIQNELNNYAG